LFLSHSKDPPLVRVFVLLYNTFLTQQREQKMTNYFVYNTKTLHFVFIYRQKAAAIKRVAKLNAERGASIYAYATKTDWENLQTV
jgi:hypothetical protein